MKLATNLFKRLSALILVFTMVLGMLPVGVHAEITKQAEKNPLTIRLVRYTQANWNEEVNGGENINAAYHYAVEFRAGDVEQVIKKPEDAEFRWDTDYNADAPEFEESLNWEDATKFTVDSFDSNELIPSLAVQVCVDGLTLVAAMVDADATNDPFKLIENWTTWEAEDTEETVYVGQAFTVPGVKPDPLSGAVTVASIDTMPAALKDYLVEEEGKYILKPQNAEGKALVAGDYTVSREVYAGVTEGTASYRDDSYHTLKVTYPDYQAKFIVAGKEYEGGEETVWLAEEQEITVSVPASVVTDAAYLPNIGGTWAKVGETWQTKVPYSETVTLGSHTLKLAVDAADLAISNTSAYVNKGNTYVKFTVNEGATGLSTVIFGDKTGTKYSGENGTYTYAFAGTLSGDQILKVTNQVNTARQVNVPVSDELTIHVEPLKDVVISNGYISKEASYKVTVNGIGNGVAIADAKLGGDSIDVETYDFNALTVGGKSLTVTDTLGRTAQTEAFPTYTLDQAGPTVDIPKNDKEFYKEAQTLTVTVTDAAGLEEVIEVKYLITNQATNEQTQKTAKVTYEQGGVKATADVDVQAGEKLTNITVSNLKDLLGNESAKREEQRTLIVDKTAPHVEVKFNYAVKGVKSFNDQIFLILNPVTDLEEGEAQNVQMNVSVNDLNWTGEEIKPFSVDVDKHTTSFLKFDFTVKDLAGNPAESILLKATDDDGVETVYEVKGNDGYFTGLLGIDRRLPSSDATAAIPRVDFNTDTKVVEEIENSNGQKVKLYGKSVTYTIALSDGEGKYDSGMLEPVFSVSKGLNCTYEDNKDGTYTVTVAADEGFETDKGYLEAKVQDNAGNNYAYRVSLALDNKKPVITVDVPKSEDDLGINEVTFYQEPVTVSISVEDMFLNSVYVDGKEIAVSNGKAGTEIKVPGERAARSILIAAGDKAGNANSDDTKPATKLVVDGTLPSIELVIKNEQDQVVDKEIKTYNGVLTYRFVVSDANLKEDTISLKYTVKENRGEENEKVIAYTDFKKDTDGKYFYEFKVEHNHQLTGYEIAATDYANNSASKTMTEGESILVDTAAPKVTVTTTIADKENAVNNVYYSQDKVTVTIKVEDDTINDLSAALVGAEATIDVIEDDKNVEKKVTVDNWTFDESETVKTGSFELNDGEMLVGLQIKVADAAGYKPEAIADFEVDDLGWLSYTGNKIVVDNTAPKAELRFEIVPDGDQNPDNDVIIEGFYVFENADKNPLRNFLKLANANKDIKEMTASTVQVRAVVKVSDPNLNVNSLLENNVGTSWDNSNSTEANAAGNYTECTTQVIQVEKDTTGIFNVKLLVSDAAGNKLVIDDFSIPKVNETDVNYTGKTIVNDGVIDLDMYVDYRRPTSGKDGEAPVISVSTDNSSVKNGDENDLFYGESNLKALKFNVAISDNNSKKTDDENFTEDFSGLEKVTYTITDEKGAVNNVDNGSLPVTNNAVDIESNIPVSVNMGTESNEVYLKIFAKDHAGNGVNYTKQFGVDSKAPRITAVYKENNPTNEKFFNTDRTVTVSIEDINPSSAVVTTDVEGISWDNVNDGTSKEFKFSKEGTYTLQVTATDLGKNSSSSISYGEDSVATEGFIIDKTAPEININKTSKGGFHTGNNIDYYNSKVNYVITVQDLYLDNRAAKGDTQKINITYKLEGKEAVTVTLPADEGEATNGKLTYQDGVYTYQFTLEDGDVLTDASVTAVDNAGNKSEKKFVDFSAEGHTIVVDEKAPVVKVSRNNDPVQTGLKGYDIYNVDVTYTVTVTDINLDPSDGFCNDSKYSYTYNTENEGAKSVDTALTWTPKLKENILDEDTMTAIFTVTDGQDLNDIFMTIKDAAGNQAKAVTDSTEKFGFSDENRLDYAGNNVIVDTTGPTATLKISSDSEENLYFYQNASGTTFVKIKNPTTSESVPEEEVKVTLTFTVTDRTLGIKHDVHGLKDLGDAKNAIYGDWSKGEGEWVEDEAPMYLFNRNGTAVYTRTVTVKSNSMGQAILNLYVEDLAGNKVAKVETEKLEGTVGEPLTFNEGVVNGTITLDRRQPTSGNDTDAPFIKVTPSVKTTQKASNGKILYSPSNMKGDDNNIVTFTLEVNDGPDNTYNAGLTAKADEPGAVNAEGSIVCEVSDADIVSYDRQNKKFDGTHKYTEDIVVTAKDNVEKNDVTLTVIATDNVGNSITFVETFAVDTKDPIIKVKFDNNDVKNLKYFNDDRRATIEITDINFNEQATNINTQIAHTDWIRDGDTYTAYLDYNVDGDYTLDINSTDLGQNYTDNSEVQYTGVATDAFTIDKTAPIIEIDYDPDEPSGYDEKDRGHYNKDQQVTVMIKEHNFRASDVESVFYVNEGTILNRNLGDFATDGADNHVASIILENGNDYNFTVAYSDLAGNPAEPYNSEYFSVDTVAPTITIDSTTMTNTQMNMVPDDLELSFIVEDAQENLSEYQVVITYLNNKFETINLAAGDYYTITDSRPKTMRINLENIPKLKEMDGVYTVQITAKDYAGNTVELTPAMNFSLNRFGSTFTTNDSFTKEFLTPGSDGVVYRNAVNGNLIIQEINPNRVYSDETLTSEGSSLTIVVNGQSIVLEKGKDYTVGVEKNGGENGVSWYVYTYEIMKEVFLENSELLNGRYSILIYGVDEAMNANTNEANEFSTIQVDENGEYTGKIEFIIDTQPPVIFTTGIETGEVYNAENQKMEIELSDGTPTSIQVYLNEEIVALRTHAETLPENEVWLVYDETTGIYTLNVIEQSALFDGQDVRVIASDAAGNTAEADVSDFFVSTSFIVRMLNSIWFYIILAALAAAGVAMIVIRRKKKAAV